ncbi:GDSL esterase/lipase At4g16230-like isoform X2 [Argentina anserina]|uniref:GDSL esterase/lipase At4g16230-like isoform X2 n=1 Tax=Argentina anserina TaxID=57926 RepID=UPI002176765C|nr:GDSL esterase/lipase At4g16230-like isoform X2 [Potentilla anserina]
MTERGSKLLCLYLSLIFASVSSSSADADNCSFTNNGVGNKIQGLFVFGSSLVDNGNNNFLETRSKADYLPYGIDFPSGPSGRFTNNKNVIDLLCDQLKLPLIPPFQDPSTKGSKIVHGVNHASGASGILNDTGSIAGNATSLSQQVLDFEEVTLANLEAQLGCNCSQSLPSYLIVVGVGGNDYMLNYFLRKLYIQISIENFTANLIASLAQKLQKLHSLGGRKFVVMSLMPLGYSPVINRPNIIGTPSQLNNAAQLYNDRLKTLLDSLRSNLSDFSFVLINQYNIISSLTYSPPSRTGFTDIRNPCCAVASLSQGGNGISCDRGGKVCGDRTAYMYFDGLHPTGAVNIEIATKAYDSTLQSDAYPINVRQLAQQQEHDETQWNKPRQN